MAHPADAIGVIFVSLLLLLPQASPSPAPVAIEPQQANPAPVRLGVGFDKNGWPVTGSDRPVPSGRPFPAGAKEAPREAAPPARTIAAAPAGESASAPLSAVLPRMSAAVGSTEAFHSLGALRIEWRMRVLGADGTALGERTVRQVSDSASGDRERLEFDDGRVFARLDGTVQVERHGMPWPTLEAAAEKELALFSLQAGIPWRLVDPACYVDAGAPRAAGNGVAVVFTRVPRPARDEVGPARERARGEAVELVVDPASGLPREMVMAADSASSRRRVLLEDWRPWNGLSIPYRRTWLDAEGRPATTLEIVDIGAGTRPTERDFRLR